MSTWEERMSQRAHAREAAALAAAKRDRLDRLEAATGLLPALPGETRVDDDDGHLGHLSHWCFPTVMCSCGEILGITCFIPSNEPEPPCEICVSRGLCEEED